MIFSSDIEQGWYCNFSLSRVHKIGHENKQAIQFSEELHYFDGDLCNMCIGTAEYGLCANPGQTYENEGRVLCCCDVNMFGRGPLCKKCVKSLGHSPYRHGLFWQSSGV